MLGYGTLRAAGKSEKEPEMTPKTPRPFCRVRHLTKRYGCGCPDCCSLTGPEAVRSICPKCLSVVACCDVSFSLFQGEVLGVVGESGSGKSTLIKLLNFDIAPTSGEFYMDPAVLKSRLKNGLGLNGQSMFELNAFLKRQIRNAIIGTVYQHPHQGLRMTVSSGGNIAERLLEADWRHVQNMRHRSAELLTKTEVPIERMDEPPKNFSGGMQQRVQIAKALSNEPVLLLLDEVTTGLDVSVQARVLDLIRKLQQELQITTVVVSHDLGVIRMLTSRTMVMKNGRVIESGLTDQVLEDPQHPYTQLLVSSAL